ncbi:putative inorganic phosphate cotransporter isoform X2 [Adelges cooleyi]|uniref:putative inorganic phosphate cotransporter isoform X2 n=1 Tax=Adelges cooleyi TaxID=133065 RepID=UPI0021802383|nr:putative inorganic phosphate cotransporter isoform X2 [Adelges cooleyi]
MNDVNCVPFLGFRHLQSFLLFLCIFTGYLLRVNLTVAIVAMSPLVNSTDYTRSKTYHIPIFDWSSKTRSTLLGSFFMGYLLGNFPASVLGCYYNNKMLLAGSTAVTAALAAVTPITLLTFGTPAMAAVRFAQGLSQSFLFPMCHGIMARWSPPNERGRLVGFVMSGIQCGTMVTLAGSGLLASSPVGWPSIFYVTGAVGLVWTVLWLVLGAESPQSGHQFLGQAEAHYINDQLKDVVSKRIQNDKTPWRCIFTSKPVWALALAHSGYNWGFWLLLTQMPTYLNTVLGLDIKKDGMLSALPYLTTFLLQFPVCYVADFLNSRECTTLTTSRKMWNTVSMWGGAAGLVTLGYLNDTTEMAIVFYVFVVAIGCTGSVGFKVNHMDLASNYAGLLMGISNAMASIGGLTAPTLVGFVVHDLTSVVEWRIVFFIGATVMFVCNLVFILYGSAVTQQWNNWDNIKTNIEQKNNVKFSAGSAEKDIELSSK